MSKQTIEQKLDTFMKNRDRHCERRRGAEKPFSLERILCALYVTQITLIMLRLATIPNKCGMKDKRR